MKKKTAVVFGTFAPLHQGHIDLIQRAKRQCDQVWVVLSSGCISSPCQVFP